MQELDQRITGSAREFVLETWPAALSDCAYQSRQQIAIGAANALYAYIVEGEFSIHDALESRWYKFNLSDTMRLFVLELTNCWPIQE